MKRDLGLGLLTLTLIGLMALRFPSFAGLTSLSRIFDDTSILILLAIGQMLVLITRSVDLSVAANLALTGMMVALFHQAYPGAPIGLIMALSIVSGALLGAINGVLTGLLGIPAIVTTLGTMAIYRGAVYVVSGGAWVTSTQMSAEFLGFVRASFLGLSTLSWLAILATASLAAWLRYTEIGRGFFAVGDNPTAARYVGVNVPATQILAFTLCGAIAGLCGYLWASRYGIAYTDLAQGFELQVIAACVIGGASIAGGVGRVTGVTLGCAFLGVLQNALPLVGVSPFWKMAVSGLIIVVAVVVHAERRGAHSLRILEKAA